MIKNQYFKLFILTPLFLLSSCISEISDNIERNKAEENYVSPYMGKWVGTFSGDHISGTLILNVSKSGSMEVIRVANNNVDETYYTSLQGAGNGALNPAPSPKGFILYGSLHTGSGTWKLQSWSGSWSVKRQ
ncbi:hypothetical protein ACM46_00520 [Chryseobacterium angstadtii]|uniref:Lipoprotein n=1 Tax=Chryseobacterium angstadtii TaxID=558151 RepID=A0A0J7IJF4_9FLAO|nr:hypothetical protein [Chryseobacterium angstadtii]KMQ66084.1 hypothetical protein ACM46_00520 [Chryseobacterium angstadtii]